MLSLIVEIQGFLLLLKCKESWEFWLLIPHQLFYWQILIITLSHIIIHFYMDFVFYLWDPWFIKLAYHIIICDITSFSENFLNKSAVIFFCHSTGIFNSSLANAKSKQEVESFSASTWAWHTGLVKCTNITWLFYFHLCWFWWKRGVSHPRKNLEMAVF